jgi:peroxiredoxin
MNILWLVSYFALWALVLFLGFLLFGALRSLALLRWRLEQVAATTPRRLGRDGLRRGKKAPNFNLPDVDGHEVSLHDFAGRKVLVVFTQVGCSPCEAIMPVLNRVEPQVQVLVVNKGDAEATRKWTAQLQPRFPVLAQDGFDVSKATRKWTAQLQPRFPVLAQDGFDVSKSYEVYATPFAFLIDEQGVVRSKGIVHNGQHIGFVLSGVDDEAGDGRDDAHPVGSQA